MKEKANRKPGLSARGIAVEILNRIELTGAYAEPLLDAHLSGDDAPIGQDRGLITELVYGTLRNRNRLDWAISRIYSGNFESMETVVRNILRTGVYQLLYTDRIPPFAIVNEAVEIAGKTRPAAAGLVNAVLRNIIRKKAEINWPDPTDDPVRAISVNDSHPRWLVERWVKLYGAEEARSICRANNAIPPLTLRVNTRRASRESLIETLENEGIFASPTRFSPEGIAVSGNTFRLRETGAFRQGLIRVQDEASQLVAHLLDPRPGQQVLDACAGAGGKTLHVAALMQNRGKIVASDINRFKLKQLLAEAKRLGATIVETAPPNGSKNTLDGENLFDRVLVDAPCSGLGTLRRNPEIRWRMQAGEIDALRLKQLELLRNAALRVRPGGRLAYSVCTTTPEETVEVAADFLKTDSRYTAVIPGNLPSELITADGFLQTFPHRHGLDGFFGALFVRKNS